MSWQDLVARQIASVTIAKAMQAAARGEDLPGTGDEPTIGLGGRRVDAGGSRLLESGRDREPERDRRSSGSDDGALADFCFDLADYLKAAGADVTERELRRGLQRLLAEGWEIDVFRRRR